MRYEMAPPDAAMYWASRSRADNDQFLLYAFDAPGEAGSADLVRELRRRAAGVADLHLAVQRVPGDLDYPRWVTTGLSDDAIVAHESGLDWEECLGAVAGMLGTQLREHGSMWRIHLFDGVREVPAASGRARVVVLQISHALGDGRRVSAIARALFGDGGTDRLDARVADRDPGVDALRGALRVGPDMARTVWLGMNAWAMREKVEPRPTELRSPVPATRLNTEPGEHRTLRTVTVPAHRVRIGGQPVTVGVLAVLAEVLPEFVERPPEQTIVELTIAFDDLESDVSGETLPRNRFQTVSIDLHGHVADRERRARLIAAEVAAARLRVNAPDRVAERRAAASAPAVLCAAGVAATGGEPPSEVSGSTLVSSVNRGPADLFLAGGRVLLTAGFPALSRVHGMTHGVHGIGDRVTVSVCSGGPAARGIDRYVTALRHAFG